MELLPENRRRGELQKIAQIIPKNLKIFKSGEILEADAGVKVVNGNEEEIRQALRYVFVLIGLEIIPEEAERTVLLNHIYKYFPDISQEEIRIAFELGINGSLDITEEEVVVKSFKRFSPAHFTKVMKAYKRYKSDVKQKVSAYLEEPDIYTDEIKKRLRIGYFNHVVLGIYWDYVESGVFSYGIARIEDIYDNLTGFEKIKPCDTRKKLLFEKYKKTVSKPKAIELAKREIIEAYFKKMRGEYEAEKLKQKKQKRRKR